MRGERHDGGGTHAAVHSELTRALIVDRRLRRLKHVRFCAGLRVANARHGIGAQGAASCDRCYGAILHLQLWCTCVVDRLKCLFLLHTEIIKSATVVRFAAFIT